MTPRRDACRGATALLVLLLVGCQSVPAPAPAPPTPAARDAVVAERDRSSAPLQAPTQSLDLPAPPSPSLPAAQVLLQLRNQLHEQDCSEGERVGHWRRRYAGNPARFATEIERSLPLMAYVLEHIQLRELPGEFAFIPIVESWYRTDARARGGPAGMWQMIPATARGNGVLVTEGYDGRYSALDSTQAALDHLGDLQERFGDWRLAAMAYNAGEFRVARAIRSHGPELIASGERRKPDGLAAGTYEYISKIKALSCLIREPGSFGIELPDEVDVVRLAPIDVGGYRGPIKTLAERLDVDADIVTLLNRGYPDTRIGARGPSTLLVPMEAAGRLPATDELAMLADQAPAMETARPPSPSSYVVRSGDTLTAIAVRQGIALRRLLRLNGLNERSIIRPGQRLKLAP